MERYGARVTRSFVLGRSLAMGYGSVLATMAFCVQVKDPFAPLPPSPNKSPKNPSARIAWIVEC